MNILINRFYTSKSNCSDDGDPYSSGKLDEIARQIKDMTVETAELSSVAYWCLLMRNDKQLERLVK